MVQGHALRRGYALLAHSVLNHLWVMPEHFGEWWGYGAFFLVAAVAQIGYVPLLLRWPNQMVLMLGIAGNSAIILLYLLTREVGIPLFGPGRWRAWGSSTCARRHPRRPSSSRSVRCYFEVS